MKCLLFLSLFLSGCATVNYKYNGDACSLAGTWLKNDGTEGGLLLACPAIESESRTQHDRITHERR